MEWKRRLESQTESLFVNDAAIEIAVHMAKRDTLSPTPYKKAGRHACICSLVSPP